MQTATTRNFQQVHQRLALFALLLGCSVGQANALDDERLLRLHLPLHLEGSQTVRLDRLIQEHYDLDLGSYLLRGVVIESDGYIDRRNAYAQLQIGRYRSGRVFVGGGQTAIDAPAYRNDQWQLRLSSGVRAHGLLVVLEEASYTSYRTRPNPRGSLGPAWYHSGTRYSYYDRYPDFYFRGRYRYGTLISRRDHNYDRHGRYADHYHRDQPLRRDLPRHDRPRQDRPRQDRSMDHQPDVREHRSADHEIAQTQRRQRQQTELALRGNHEATRRPDRPIRQRIEPAAGSPPATTEAPRAKDHRNERNRPAPDVPNRAVLKRGGADNGSRRVHQ